MPSNKDLIAECGELSAELGVEIDTRGLNNKQLTSLAKDLRAKLSDAETATQLDEVEQTEVEQTEVEQTEVEQTEVEHVVAKGKAVTSLKGVLSDGDEVKPEFFRGGATDFDSLLASGVLVKK